MALGAELTGIELSADNLVELSGVLYEQLLEHKVIFLRDQPLTPALHVGLAETFGELDVPHPVYPHLAEHPAVVVLDNDGDHPPDANDWHKDLTFRAEPAFMSILHAVSVPPAGGDTLWINTAAAFAALPRGMQTELAELSAIHDMGTFRNDYLGDANDIAKVNEALQ